MNQSKNIYQKAGFIKPCFSILYLITITSFLNAQWIIEDTLQGDGIYNYICVVDSGVVWTVGDYWSGGNFIARRSSSGQWVNVGLDGIYLNQTLTGIAARDYQNAWVTDCFGGSNGGAHIYRTSNGGLNWIIQVSTGGNQGYFNDIRFSKNNNSFGYAWSDPPNGNGTPFKIYKTTNEGITWNEFLVNVDTHFVGSTWSMCITDSNHAWFGLYRNLGGSDYGRIMYTTNGGLNFNYSLLSAFGTNIGAIEFKTDNLFGLTIMPDQLNLVFKSTNNGNSWSYYNSGYPLGLARRLISIPNSEVWYVAIFSSDGDRIYKSIDNGNSWSPMIIPNQSYNITHMDAVFVNNKVFAYAITAGGLVLRMVDTISLIGINNNSNLIPKAFSLSQNYPNPFNPLTTIKYSLIKQGLVKLVVYDILGKEVITLVNEIKQAGNFSVNFDATNYASGIYFYRLEVVDFVNVKKMVLIK
jgi:photosystem II stability/assembly factor-like uncharacterized protein